VTVEAISSDPFTLFMISSIVGGTAFRVGIFNIDTLLAS
jgi:hypothetical protein